jgi:hypothetical protein
MQNKLAQALKSYTLPDDVLPLSPHRQLFVCFNSATLASAAQLALDHPEKRGPLSHAARKAAGVKDSSVLRDKYIIMELHLDARALPQELADELLAMGFEPDGFHQFMPREFTEHMTLKFKFSQEDQEKHRQLHNYFKNKFLACQKLLKQWPNVEAYIEWEVYTSSNRRFWNPEKLAGHWEEDFSLAMSVMDVSRSLECDTAKKADIHIKIGKVGLAAHQTEPDHELGHALITAGFYRVITWAGNEIYTAQFAAARDAKKVFDRLEKFFNRHGGAVEMTMEPAPRFWRTTNRSNGEWLQARVPPVVTAVQNLG